MDLTPQSLDDAIESLNKFIDHMLNTTELNCEENESNIIGNSNIVSKLKIGDIVRLDDGRFAEVWPFTFDAHLLVPIVLSEAQRSYYNELWC